VTIYESSAIFSITSQKEIQFIIELFMKYPLNSTKHLNFLDFNRAFKLYTNSKIKVPELVLEIESIKNNMNSKRTVFEMPKSHQIHITPN
jgi:dsRNA-specific ribonuclease